MTKLRNHPHRRGVAAAFGFRPYSAAIGTFGKVATLRTFDLEVHDGAIRLTD